MLAPTSHKNEGVGVGRCLVLALAEVEAGGGIRLLSGVWGGVSGGEGEFSYPPPSLLPLSYFLYSVPLTSLDFLP